MFIFRLKKSFFFWLSPLPRPHPTSDFASKILEVSKGLQPRPTAYPETPGYASASASVNVQFFS